MRVVAGLAKGRPLAAPPGRSTRPTTDRVREAIFNALASLGAVQDARVLDAFAGTGALGIEALSRGASHATFVERDRAVAELLRANLARTQLAERATVLVGDVLARRWDQRFDLALLDPPYAFDGWPELLARLPAELIVTESDRELALDASWEVVRVKRYGGTVVTFAQAVTPSEKATHP